MQYLKHVSAEGRISNVSRRDIIEVILELVVTERDRPARGIAKSQLLYYTGRREFHQHMLRCYIQELGQPQRCCCAP